MIFVTIAIFKLLLKHMKNTHGGEKPHSFFWKHTLAVHFVKTLFQCDICDYCWFQVVIKTHAKIGKNFIEKSNGSVSKATPWRSPPEGHIFNFSDLVKSQDIKDFFLTFPADFDSEQLYFHLRVGLNQRAVVKIHLFGFLKVINC